MCRQRHKTAYGRRQLQIGQQTVLYRYKMHESTEDPRSTPLTACLGFSFWTKQPRFLWRALEEHLRELRSDWSRSEWELEWGHEARVGQNRGCGFTSKSVCDADWSVPSCTEQTPAMTRWRRGDDLLKGSFSTSEIITSMWKQGWLQASHPGESSASGWFQKKVAQEK